MNIPDRIAFLKEATVAMDAMKLAADAYVDHKNTCVICTSRVRRLFLNCLTEKKLAFDYVVAKVDMEPYCTGLKKLQSELEVHEESRKGAASVEWLDSLYKLPDHRVKRSIK